MPGSTRPALSPLRDRIGRSVPWVVWSRGVVQLLSFLSTLAVAVLSMRLGLLASGIDIVVVRLAAMIVVGGALYAALALRRAAPIRLFRRPLPGAASG